MSTKYLIIILCFCLVSAVRAQIFEEEIDLPKNELSLQIGGHGLLYSVDYQRYIHQNEMYKFGFQISAAYYPRFIDRYPFVMPIGFNHSFMSDGHGLVLGYGASLIYEEQSFAQAFFIRTPLYFRYINLKLGYRYDFQYSPLFIGIAFTPFWEPGIPDIGPFNEPGFDLGQYVFVASGALRFGWRF